MSDELFLNELSVKQCAYSGNSVIDIVVWYLCGSGCCTPKSRSSDAANVILDVLHDCSHGAQNKEGEPLSH